MTFVARQAGEAWNRPFVSIYEPSSVKEPGQILSVTYPSVKCEDEGSHVGICVEQKDSRKDYIFSSDNPAHLCSIDKMQVKATYAVCGSKNNEDCMLFMGMVLYCRLPL